MTDDDTVADRLRRVADGLRRFVDAEADEPDESEEHVAPLERTLRKKQREKIDDVAEELSEE